MKKTYFILVVLLAASTGFSQIRLGAKAGLNIGSLKGPYAANVSNKQKIGFHGGLTAEYLMANPKFSLVGEALYSTQGSISNLSQGGLTNGENGLEYQYNDQETTLSFTAIDVPIMLKYYVLDKLSIEGGPQVGFIINAKSKTEYSSSADPSQNRTVTINPLSDGSYFVGNTPYYYKKTLSSFDYGLKAGASYDFSDNFNFSLHYYFGLNTILREPISNGLYASSSDYRNAIFEFSLGYKFY